jgi:hypothetical protein
MIRPTATVLGFALIVASAVPIAQSRDAVTTADYDRAVRMLAPALNGLVVNDAVNVTWLPDGRFWYVRTTASGPENVVVDPVKKTREVVATPPAGGEQAPAGGGRGGRGGGGRGGRGGGGRGGPAITRTCGPNVTGLSGTPVASVSPDGSKAIYICDWNLWVRDVATGQERQLTTDGEKNFGYATSNAGWTTSAGTALSWSPDSKKIATQQQDERKVGDMFLVQTPVDGGHPVLRAWKYPLAGDPEVAMIHRVVIDVDTGKMTRLKMDPDFHRAMSEDNIDMGEYLWSPDATRLGFVSTDRYHKWSTALHRDREDACPDARAVADLLGQERSPLVLAARRLRTALPLRPEIRGTQEQDHRRGRHGDPCRPDRSSDKDDVVRGGRKGEGTGSLLLTPLSGRARRQEQRLADARQRHAFRAALARRQVRDRHLLSGGCRT